MDLFEAIARRHSYRGPFADAPVPRDDLRKIVEAGIRAPSAVNKQVTRFVIVDDPKLPADIAPVSDQGEALGRQVMEAATAEEVRQQLPGQEVLPMYQALFVLRVFTPGLKAAAESPPAVEPPPAAALEEAK